MKFNQQDKHGATSYAADWTRHLLRETDQELVCLSLQNLKGGGTDVLCQLGGQHIMLKIFLNSVKMNLSIVNMSTICLFNDRSSSLQTNQIRFTSYQLPVTSCWLMVRGMIEGRPTPSTTLSLLSHPSPPNDLQDAFKEFLSTRQPEIVLYKVGPWGQRGACSIPMFGDVKGFTELLLIEIFFPDEENPAPVPPALLFSRPAASSPSLCHRSFHKLPELIILVHQ
jgi:hypothetical protein